LTSGRAATRNGKPGNCPPPRSFCKHDGIHVLHMRSYFSRLRYLYVKFFSRQLFRIRAALYWIKLLTKQCTMLRKTLSTESETISEALVMRGNHSVATWGFGYPPKQSSKSHQIEIWNVINQCNFCQLGMSSPPHKHKSPHLRLSGDGSAWNRPFHESDVVVVKMWPHRAGIHMLPIRDVVLTKKVREAGNAPKNLTILKQL